MTEELGDGGNDWAVVLLLVVKLEERNSEKFEIFGDGEGTFVWVFGVRKGFEKG